MFNFPHNLWLEVSSRGKCGMCGEGGADPDHMANFSFPLWVLVLVYTFEYEYREAPLWL